MKDYQKLIKNIRERSNPESLLLEKAFTDELSSISYSDVLKYISYAMKGVETVYTKRSKLAGERVQIHLKEILTSVVYKYQGSVMTNTHIKGASDIDLLVIADNFHTFDRKTITEVLNTESIRSQLSQSQKIKLQNELKGGGYLNGSNDLRKNRLDSENRLNTVYDICDMSHPKAIKITNKNLNRDVDVVIAAWYDNVISVLQDKKEEFRGVQIYNKDTNSKGNPDYPFLSIKRINERSSETNGRLKKMIRFIKNIKADSKLEITLSSFDLNAICYDIKTEDYKSKIFYELVPVVFLQLKKISEDEDKANNLKSVDGNEYIFRNNPNKLDSLKNLLSEVEYILSDLYKTYIR